LGRETRRQFPDPPVPAFVSFITKAVDLVVITLIFTALT
jgi:hypothetical protein